jgi:hypothetical protein
MIGNQVRAWRTLKKRLNPVLLDKNAIVFAVFTPRKPATSADLSWFTTNETISSGHFFEKKFFLICSVAGVCWETLVEM